MVLKELDRIQAVIAGIRDKEIADLFLDTFLETAEKVQLCTPDKAKEMLSQIRRNAEYYSRIERGSEQIPRKKELRNLEIVEFSKGGRNEDNQTL